ncbi:MAG TPA: ABC transporter permease, partial [Roseiarcus sp.]|nr:ABC transporter permease [Roseiarcus sp.]
LERFGLSLTLAIPLALIVGVGGGVINGLLTSRTGVNGFIVTLATGSAFAGINHGLTQSRPFHGIPKAFVALGDSRWGFIPALMWPPLAVAPLLGLFLYRLKAGRWLLAVGGNPSAAQLSGISTNAVVTLAHAISGGLSGLAAILAVAQLGAAQPETGAGWLLVSFAGPIIGGASLAGGSVSITGTFLAVLVIALIENVLVLTNVDPYWVQFMLGALLMLTVAINRWRAIRAARG